MATRVSDTVGEALSSALREALRNVGDTDQKKKRGGPLSGATGLAAGAGLAAAAVPLAKRVRANGGLPSPSGSIGTGLMIAKAANNLRQAKDSVLDELDRVRDYIEVQGLDPGAWLGRPNDDQDDSDDDEGVNEETSGSGENGEVDEEENGRPERTRRFDRQAKASRGAAASTSSPSRTAGGSSKSRASKSRSSSRSGSS